MLIKGKDILAMSNDFTSVKEMLQMMGVEPTDEVINEATQSFALNGNQITMDSLYDFLKQKSVMSKLKAPLKCMAICDTRGMSKEISIKDMR